MSELSAQSWLESFRDDKINTPFNNISKNDSKKRNATTVSITGGKGGVGKTSVALKIAKELSQRGEKVLLIDCDYNLANTSIKLGLPIRSDFYDLISMSKNFEDCLVKNGNFHLLSGCNGDLNLFEENFELDKIVIDIINAHKNEYDYIFVDCPAGLNRKILTINAYCDDRVVVLTPDKSSITDSYSLIKVLNMKYGVKENHIVVNKLTSNVQYKRVVKTISETAENYLGCRTLVLGGVKRSDEVSDKFDRALLWDANSAVHKSFVKVVDSLSEKLTGRASVSSVGAFS